MEKRPEYLPLTKDWRLPLFAGKGKYLYLSFQLLRRLDRFQWLGLEFNRYPHGGHCDSYLNLTLFSCRLAVGIHSGMYDQSVDTGE